MAGPEKIIRRVLELLESAPQADFSGFGLVIYRGVIDDFPVTALLAESELPMPISGDREIADYLVAISRYSDVRHDGFHFAHVREGLTHIAQFFSPAIPGGYRPGKFGIGARYRSAELGSLSRNVSSITIFGRDGGFVVFENGMEVSK